MHAHPHIVVVLNLKPKISKKPKPEDIRVQRQLLRSLCSHLHRDLSSQADTLYFTPQISLPTHPSLPGTYLVLAIQVPRSGKPLNPTNLDSLVTQQAAFHEPTPRVQDTPLSLTSASISLLCHQPPFQSLGLTTQHLNCHGSQT